MEIRIIIYFICDNVEGVLLKHTYFQGYTTIAMTIVGI